MREGECIPGDGDAHAERSCAHTREHVPVDHPSLLRGAIGTYGIQ